MSTKENIDYLKEELNSEEKFLESFVKAEKFYKKYKKVIIGVVALVVIGAVSFVVKQNLDENNKMEANIAFDKFLSNNDDNEALETLKSKNSDLYQIAQFLKAEKTGDKIDINLEYFKQFAEYNNALKTKNVEDLNIVSMQDDFLLKEFALFNKAFLLTQNKKYKEAKDTLKLIPKDTKAYELATLLNHYLATK